MIPREAVRAASEAMACRWMPRSKKHPDCDLCLETAKEALTAASPFLRAQALEDAADELARLHGIGMRRSDLCTPEEKADYRAYAEHDGDYSEWLRVRAATERGQG